MLIERPPDFSRPFFAFFNEIAKNRHQLVHSTPAPYTSQLALSNFCVFSCIEHSTSRIAGYRYVSISFARHTSHDPGNFRENVDFCWLKNALPTSLRMLLFRRPQKGPHCSTLESYNTFYSCELSGQTLGKSEAEDDPVVIETRRQFS